MSLHPLSVTRLPELRAATSLLLAIAERGSDRLTLSQAAFFLFAAKSDVAGRPATRSQLLTASGAEFRPSIRNSYRQLLSASRVYPKALGWLQTKQNPKDLREQILCLTETGLQVIEGALSAQALAIVHGDDV